MAISRREPISRKETHEVAQGQVQGAASGLEQFPVSIQPGG